MRTSVFIFMTWICFQVSRTKATDSAAENGPKSLVQELSNDQAIELIELLLKEEQEKQAEQEDSDPLVLPSDEGMLRSLIAESLKSQKEEDSKATTTTKDSEPVKRLAEYLHQSPGMAARGRTARVHLQALRAYKEEWQKKRGLDASNEEFLRLVRQVQAPATHISRKPDQEFPHEDGTCYIVDVDCEGVEHNRFRFFDGSCNNVQRGRTMWGSTERAMTRLLTPDYADGISEPRVSSNEFPLPSAREVSIRINRASQIQDSEIEDRLSKVNTLLMMQVGQFLDHDVTHTPAYGEDEPCDCDTDFNDVCFPIPLEDGHGLGKCIAFRRSLPAHVDSCSLSHREQGNSLTAWVDASQVYGNSLELAEKLRDHTPASTFGRQHGKMLTRTNPQTHKFTDQLMPPEEGCPPTNTTCQFLAGDVRANEQPGLTSMHTVFVRLHNVFEQNMFRYNRHWDGERLYQETRRLVIAVWQHIVFDEYLQVILGRTQFENYQLAYHLGGYNSSMNPDIANEFSTAAFRFGHTEVPDVLPYRDFTYEYDENRNLADNFFNPADTYRCPISAMSGVDSLMLGMSDTPGEELDSYFSDTIREHLFAGGSGKPGMDLPALNIQRGREHGIPGYGHALEFCGFAVNFRKIRRELKGELQDLYGSLDDGRRDTEVLNNMDLFAAGVSEDPVNDGQLGPTFSCLIGEQFKRIKHGDRFFYTFPGAGFSFQQLENIQQYNLASVLCDVMDEPNYMQEWALLKPWEGYMNRGMDRRLAAIYRGMTNERKLCSELPKINFALFREP